MTDTVIEAGHYYKVNGPSEMSLKGWKIGKKLAANFDNSSLVLFVDDYHTEQTFLEPGDRYLPRDRADKAAQFMQDEADYCFSEANFAETAPRKIEELLDDGLVKSKKGVVTVGGVRLGSVVDNNISSFQPTCVFLDYMLLNAKTEHGETQITVLPDAYKSQQNQLLTVIGKLTVSNLSDYKSVFYGIDLAQSDAGRGISL